jgi:hypothetical protein
LRVRQRVCSKGDKVDPSANLFSILARAAIFIAAFLAVSTLLSFFVENIARLINSTIESITAFSAWLTEQANSGLQSFRTRFWRDSMSEPRSPIVSELAVLESSARTFPRTEVRRLERLGRALDANVRRLRSISGALDLAKSKGVNGLIDLAAKPRAGLAVPFLLIVMISAFGLLNAFLLHLFFRETIGSQRLLPYPLPDLQTSHALAGLFVFLEVSAGMVLHYLESDPERDSGAARIYRFVPWLVIVVLLFIEIVAYSVMSSSIDLPGKLNVPEASPFYAMLKYFLAGFGAALTLILSALGYTVWRAFGRYNAGRRERAAIKAFQDLEGSLEKIDERASEVERNLVRLREWPETFAATLSAAFGQGLGADTHRTSLAQFVHVQIQQILNRPEAASSEQPPILRTRGQVLADLALGTVTGIIWIALLALFAGSVMEHLIMRRPTITTGAATAIGWISASAVALFGFMLRGAPGTSRSSSEASSVVLGAVARKAVTIVGIAGLVVSATIASILAVRMRMLGADQLLNASFGALLVLSLAAASFLFHAFALSMVRVAHALYRLGLDLLARFLVGALMVIRLVLFVLRQVLRLIAVPGDWVRSRFLLLEPS